MIPLSKYIIAMELFDNALSAGGAWCGGEQVSGRRGDINDDGNDTNDPVTATESN